jgi:putative endonuclease
MHSKTYFVYLMASKRNGTLYIGMTSDLIRRVWEHREGILPGFTKRYGVKMLVYYEAFDDVYAAIHRENRLKKYKL